MMEQNIKEFSLSKPTCTSSLTLLYAFPQSHLSICLNEDGIIFFKSTPFITSFSFFFLFHADCKIVPVRQKHFDIWTPITHGFIIKPMVEQKNI